MYGSYKININLKTLLSMKKNLLFVVLTLLVSFASAQDTITGWTFPVNTGTDSLNANLGTNQNQGYDLRFQLYQTPTSDSTINTITFIEGATTYAASTTGWQEGNGVRFWSAKFKAGDYKNFKVSSKQRSTDGPRDFKLQWRLSSSAFEDVPGGTITVADDWTTGVVNQLEVPITGQGTSSVYIRWVMNSNTDVNGGTVAPGGSSAIDDIIVTAQSTLGTEEILFTDQVAVYPNPGKGIFTVQSTRTLTDIAVYDETGKTIRLLNHPGSKTSVDMTGFSKGIYFLKVRFVDNDQTYTRKFILE